MRLIELWRRLIASIRHRRLERDLDDEMAFHLSMRQQNIAATVEPAVDARAEARRQFGNPAVLKDQMRDIWTFPTLESFWQDVRYACRSLARSPAFSVVAIIALAFGIGGNTAIFSLVDAVRARALPYRDSHQLVELIGNAQRQGLDRTGASYPDFLDWREQSRSFEGLAAFDAQMQTLSGIDEAERVSAEFASAAYFSLLGVAPAHGRVFQPQEDELSNPAFVVVMSDGLWKRRFGSDPDVVGRLVTVNGEPHTVLGVMPPGFRGISDAAELWIPFTRWAPSSTMADRGARGFTVVARLKPGVTVDAAQRDMNAIARRLEQAHTASNEKRGVEVSPLDVEILGMFRQILGLLMAAVGFVLLIACANVANLSIARLEARRGEVAVRAALGAGRGRLIRQLMTESCVLTGFGAALGLVLAQALVAVLLAASPVTFPSFVTPTVDLRVAAFTVMISFLCGILVGVVPGLQTPAADLVASLKDSTRATAGRRGSRVRQTLVMAEIALAVILLIGAGLMIQSVRRLATLPLGFDPDHVLTVHASIPRSTTARSERTGGGAPPLVESRVLLERLSAIPGVRSASLGNDLPFAGDSPAGTYTADGHPVFDAQNRPRAFQHRITQGYFATFGIPLVAGRTFSDVEMAGPSPAVIVSDSVIKRFWPGQDPIGKRLKLGRPDSEQPWLSIVGVAADVKFRGFLGNRTADPDIYFPFLERNSQVAIAIRTSMPPAQLVAPVRAVIRDASASIPIYNVATMDERIAGRTAPWRFMMWLMGAFAAMALLLSIVGVYGVISYLVVQRTREIGIRLALGARRSEIMRLVVGDGAYLLAVGIVCGASGAAVLHRLAARLFLGVAVTDASAFVAISILAAVAFVACVVPARRAARIDPIDALRTE